MGATEEELQETMTIAMVVAATKIKLFQENALASLPEKTMPAAPGESEQEKTPTPAPGST